MFTNIFKISSYDFFQIRKAFRSYEEDRWYGNKPKVVFHTLSSFQESDGTYYFRFDLIYEKDLPQLVRRIFGDLASFDSDGKFWKIRAVPCECNLDMLLNNMRSFTSSLNKYFLAPSFYDLVDKIKYLIEENREK